MSPDVGQLFESAAQRGSLACRRFQQHHGLRFGSLKGLVKSTDETVQSGLNPVAAVRTGMDYEEGNSQFVAALQFASETLNGLGLQIIFVAGQIDQIRAMGGDDHLAVLIPGFSKFIHFLPGEWLGIPLALVPGKNLQGITADPGNPVKSEVQSFAHRLVGT